MMLSSLEFYHNNIEITLKLAFHFDFYTKQKSTFD